MLASTAGIVDTGTTLVLLATDAFNTYMQLTGATLDQTTGLLTISQADYANLQSLNFNVGSTTLEFTADGQVRYQSHPSEMKLSLIGGRRLSLVLLTLPSVEMPTASISSLLMYVPPLQSLAHVLTCILVAWKQLGIRSRFHQWLHILGEVLLGERRLHINARDGSKTHRHQCRSSIRRTTRSALRLRRRRTPLRMGRLKQSRKITYNTLRT